MMRQTTQNGSKTEKTRNGKAATLQVVTNGATIKPFAQILPSFQAILKKASLSLVKFGFGGIVGFLLANSNADGAEPQMAYSQMASKHMAYSAETSNGYANSAPVAVSSRDAMWGTSGVHYEVLSRPAGRKEEPKLRTWAPEVVRPVKPYSYGWFGASSSSHWYRQFGHQHSHVNYSRR